MALLSELKQREFDGKWVHWQYMQDPTEDPRDWEEREMFLPKRWIQVAVYDWEIVLDD